MAIVEMSKIRLIGLDYHKERILNTLHKSGSVELVETKEIPDTFCVAEDKDIADLREKYERAKFAVDFFTENIEKSKDKDYFPKEAENSLKNFFVSYDEFMSASGNEMELLYVIDKIYDYSNRLLENRMKKVRLSNLLSQLLPYSELSAKFSDFKDTKLTTTALGLIKKENLPAFDEYIADKELVFYNSLSETANDFVISVTSFNEISEEVMQKLSELGFNRCSFDFDVTPAEKIEEIKTELNSCEEYDEKIVKKTCGRAGNLRNLKILTDYYKFQIEKAEDSESFRHTGKTFILEGYLPKDKQIEVSNSIYDVTNAVFMEFSEPTEDDDPPTLLKNNKIIRQGEFVTDMYSTPNYREMDPNKVTFFFFMLFMGLIMADVGYGIIMIALGCMLARRIKVDNGTRRLWYVIAIGGVFAIIFGLLFNSFFGVELLPISILPSPVPSGDGMTNLMTILVGCLALGIVQIAVGYFCKALNCFKHGKILDGIFDGLVWVLFFIGFVCAAFNFIVGYLMPEVDQNTPVFNFFKTVQMPGLYLTIGSIVIAAITAGRHEKGFGKFSKGFGAVYGLISIMSDILSYARLFGLMLSGMIIAQQFNKMGISLITGGGAGYALGPVVILAGHTFNIAMGVLGAYIHDSRLQYIEFFSKFYTGEGRKFSPLGSKTDYIYLTK